MSVNWCFYLVGYVSELGCVTASWDAYMGVGVSAGGLNEARAVPQLFPCLPRQPQWKRWRSTYPLTTSQCGGAPDPPGSPPSPRRLRARDAQASVSPCSPHACAPAGLPAPPSGGAEGPLTLGRLHFARSPPPVLALPPRRRPLFLAKLWSRQRRRRRRAPCVGGAAGLGPGARAGCRGSRPPAVREVRGPRAGGGMAGGRGAPAGPV